MTLLVIKIYLKKAKLSGKKLANYIGCQKKICLLKGLRKERLP